MLAIIKQVKRIMHRVVSTLDFKIFQPKGLLSTQVQGVWSASVSPQGSNDIKRWLHSDACSGILFNLSSEIYLNDTPLPPGVLLLPVSKQAQLITLPPGSQVVGVRFHPAMSFSIFGTLYDQPTTLKVEDDFSFALYSLHQQLGNVQGHYAQIIALYRWLHKIIDSSNMIPCSLIKALNVLNPNMTLGSLSEYVPLSQRQTERQFQRWMNMTPKYYQRILRVKSTLNFLRYNPDTELADLALSNGFTDQAHMTREFKQIAKTTPRQYSKLVTYDKAV